MGKKTFISGCTCCCKNYNITSQTVKIYFWIINAVDEVPIILLVKGFVCSTKRWDWSIYGLIGSKSKGKCKLTAQNTIHLWPYLHQNWIYMLITICDNFIFDTYPSKSWAFSDLSPFKMYCWDRICTPLSQLCLYLVSEMQCAIPSYRGMQDTTYCLQKYAAIV